MRSLRWRLIMLAVVAAISVGVSAGVASATKPTRGTCTPNFTLTLVDPPADLKLYMGADARVLVLP